MYKEKEMIPEHLQYAAPDEAKNRVSFGTLFFAFFRIGLFTLGGGLAMLPVIRHELVIRRGWLKESDFISVISLATVVPGVIAVNVAYLLGSRVLGKRGAAFAVLGTVLPSFFVILVVAGILLPFFNYPKVDAFLRGCAIAVAGQLAFAGFIFGRTLLRRWTHLLVCAVGVIIVGAGGMHPIFGLVAASILGYWLFPGSKT